jgi:hypothetical protein
LLFDLFVWRSSLDAFALFLICILQFPPSETALLMSDQPQTGLGDRASLVRVNVNTHHISSSSTSSGGGSSSNERSWDLRGEGYPEGHVTGEPSRVAEIEDGCAAALTKLYDLVVLGCDEQIPR